MTDCINPECPKRIERIYNQLNDQDGICDRLHDVTKTANMVERRQAERTILIDSKMPKKWLWTIIALVAPVTGIALTILIFQATASAKFADKEMVIRHEEKICSMQKILENHVETEKQTVQKLEEILKAVRK